MKNSKKFFKTFYKIHDSLFISGFISERNLDEAVELGITAIVNLMEFQGYDPRPKIAFLHAGYKDQIYVPREILSEIFTFIEDQMKNGKVLVHCGQGVSRSGGIIIGRLLIEHPEWTWDDALEFANKSRYIMPAQKIKKSILDYLESIEGQRRE
ncbi:MAG: dual specificity protein phosphatase family protein [Promethearchaeota archaeon]